MPRALALLLAVSLTGNPGVTGAVPSLTLIGCGLALALSSLLLWKRGAAPPRATILAMLLGCWSIVGYSNSPAPYLTSLGLASVAGFVAVVAGLELSIRSTSQWRECARIFVFLAMVSALHGLWTWQSNGGTGALRSTFTNADTYSVIPLLAFFLAVGLAVESNDRWRLLTAASTIPLGVAVLLTASRAGLVALMVGYGAFLLTLASSRSQQLRTRALKLFVIPISLLLLVLMTGSSLQVLERFQKLGAGQDPVTIASRWDVVRHGYKSILRSPVLGCGLGCFHLAYQQDRTALSAGEDYMNVAHNDYMQWFVETGLPGGILWILLLGFNLLSAWRSYRSPTPWVAAEIGATVAIGLFCVFNFACPVPADLLWIGAILGLGGSLPRLQENPDRSPWSPKAFPFSLFLGSWAVWTIGLGLTCLRVQSTERSAAESEGSLDWETAFIKLQSAAKLQPQNFLLSLKLAELANKAFLFSGQDDWLEKRHQALMQAYEANPRDLRILLTLIRFLNEQQRPGEAEPYVRIAEAQAPYSPYVQRAKARNQIMLGQLNEAVATLTTMDRTGKVADDAALATLIYYLESKSKGKGADFLVKIAADDPKRAVNLALTAASPSQKLKDPAAALRLLKRIRYIAPDRGDLAWETAAAHRSAGNQEAEAKLLDKLLAQSSLEMDRPIQEKIWRRWGEIHIKKGELDLVLLKLEDYLINHQRLIWPREMMAAIYLKRDQRAEARAALREGIPYDTDGNLRIELAELCASQGLTDLARSYYREALTVSNQKEAIQKKLTQLKSKSDDLEDEEQPLEPTESPGGNT